MGNNKETRARRNEWERTFPRLFACFRACVECMRSRRELFVSRGCVLSYLRYCFSCKYGGRGWCRSNSLPGSNPRLDLDRFHASRDNFGQSPVPLVIFLAREKGVKCLSSISNRKFRDQIHPRFEARYYFSVNDERWNLKKETVYCYIIFEDARERIF